MTTRRWARPCMLMNCLLPRCAVDTLLPEASRFGPWIWKVSIVAATKSTVACSSQCKSWQSYKLHISYMAWCACHFRPTPVPRNGQRAHGRAGPRPASATSTPHARALVQDMQEPNPMPPPTGAQPQLGPHATPQLDERLISPAAWYSAHAMHVHGRVQSHVIACS